MIIFLSVGATAAEEWYHLFGAEKCVAEFTLRGGESKEVTIDANERMWVSFETKTSIAGYDDIKNPIKIGPKYGEHPWASCSSGNGAGTVFEPIEGSIEVVIENNTPDTFTMVVTTKPDKD